MLKNKQYIINLKFKFFYFLLDWFMENAPIENLEEAFHIFIEDLNINITKVIECMEIKEEARGGFKKNIILKYCLINIKEKELLKKYFMSSDNIFHGAVLVEDYKDQVFYKFLLEKAVRDKIISKGDSYLDKTEIIDNKLFYTLLHRKLLEEAKEILRARNSVNLLEEIADLYAIISELKFRNHNTLLYNR